MSQNTTTGDIGQQAVFIKTDPYECGLLQKEVRGYDFNNDLKDLNKPIDYNALLESYYTTGFQAHNFGEAVNILNAMLRWRLSDEPMMENEQEPYDDPEVRKNTKCKVFLGYTSNMVSCGVREVIRFLVQHKLVDAIVTTCGAIEEDIMKTMQPTYLGAFDLDGKMLRLNGINRIGNLLIANQNYCKFEDWITPVLDAMLEEQYKGKLWSPSLMIDRFGKELNNEDSILYWAHKNEIPIYCPSLTDGSIGDMLYFHSYSDKKGDGLVCDIVSDIRRLNGQAVRAKKTGMVILGGGVIKHHICNANLMRNGADFTVYINTGQEFDGSDAGARCDEAVSWGKIRLGSRHTKIYAEASLIFPLLVAQTFVKYQREQEEKKLKEQQQ
ncbi:deoxyhypusine synthase [Naegleria gruberi]|uniref:deoxyhypusine synthase n=1 Tax=Naegleria gruberi TaxID=5762 RepID=D2VJ07_NAEGR|nr:deoxyhypusine synthase [Naegleria gruberi]EFC43118.1 deoxyhypusine synthase [Naegleria gruberi]|eukprot:XP_002675862.1 deoxyhypusine synthase [Naegleria gruberi strain NEG-M]